MKTKILILTTALLIIQQLPLKSQGPYGQYRYTHSVPTWLTSGTIVTNNPGFLMASYIPSASGSPQINFCVDKTDIDGHFNSATDFSMEYEVTLTPGPDCSSPLQPMADCYGVTVIESDPSLGIDDYYVVGSTGYGVFFASLDAGGNSTTLGFYTFANTSLQPVGKPLITGFSTSPGSGVGHFYICGYYINSSGTDEMYVIKVNQAGGVIGIAFSYDLGTGTRLRPTAIMESPYTTASNEELIIVGWCDDLQGSNEDGFFLRYNDLASSVTQFTAYDSGSNDNERIYAVNVAASTSALSQPGYIIGGSSNMSSSHPWMMFIDDQGTVGWSSIITPSSHNPGGPVVGVVERFNSSNQYEYYGVSTKSSDMTVFKLDDAGTPAVGLNEFEYQTLNANSGEAITQFNGSGGPNEGIHVYGRYTDNSGHTDHYLALACFSGHTGCTSNETLSGISVANGPALNITLSSNQNTGPVNCQQISITDHSGPAGVHQVCAPTVAGLPPGGSNARKGVGVGIEESAKSDQFKTYPVPATNELFVELGDNFQGPTVVALENNLGQEVWKGQAADSETSVRISLEGVAGGMYLLKLSNGQGTFCKPVLIQAK